MAVVTVKSQAITNRDATPPVLNNSNVEAAFLHAAVGRAPIANGDSAGSKYLLFSVPSNARMASLRVTAPDIGTTTAADIGLYKNTKDGGAVVDADFFASALALNAGAVDAENLQESGVVSNANLEKMVWQILGLAADPNLVYDVVATLTGAADAAGEIVVRGEWAQ